jgi:hypothetical protein
LLHKVEVSYNSSIELFHTADWQVNTLAAGTAGKPHQQGVGTFLQASV